METFRRLLSVLILKMETQFFCTFCVLCWLLLFSIFGIQAKHGKLDMALHCLRFHIAYVCCKGLTYVNAIHIQLLVRNICCLYQVPKVYWELSSGRVLTMEYCEGGKVDDRQYMKEHDINVNEVWKYTTLHIQNFDEVLCDFNLIKTYIFSFKFRSIDYSG